MLTTEDRAEVQRLIADAFWSASAEDLFAEVAARAMEVFGSQEMALW